MKTTLLLVAALAGLGSATLASDQTAAPAPVKTTIVPMTFPVELALEQSRGGGPGFYPQRGTVHTENRTVDVIQLDNGIVQAWVVPAWAGRLIRAFDLATKADYFLWKEKAKGILGWDLPGGVKPGFPFFEHGTHLDQPASYRIVHAADGSATVAMDLRFTQYTAPAESARYGRFGDEPLNIMVTLKPGSAVVSWRQRKENPNPLPRAERLWNDTLFPVARPLGPDGREDRAAMQQHTRFIFPARYVTDHGPTTVHSSPHWSCPDNWDVSHFAIDAPYGFVGVYDVPHRINRLRLNDPATAPAAKLYTCFWGDFCEHWGGVGYVFEKPGELRPAYEPVEFTHRYWIAQDIGQASFANDNVAVAVNGTNFELVASSPYTLTISDATGKTVAAGPAGPHTVLKGSFDGHRLVIRAADQQLLAHDFPLDRPTPAKDKAIPPAIKQRFAQIVASANLEGETVAHNEGTPGILDGIKSNPRIAYRFGQFDLALTLLGAASDPASDYLRALIAWEKGEPVDFKSALWEADYLRALQAIQKHDVKAAIALAQNYEKHVPTAWYPRLARAYWSRDQAVAATLAQENPGSPEAQLVLKLLGLPHDLAALLQNNPAAETQTASFELQLTKGQWKHLPRYPLAANASK